jgi:C-terminal processing protease CtpA/Prc
MVRSRRKSDARASVEVKHSAAHASYLAVSVCSVLGLVAATVAIGAEPGSSEKPGSTEKIEKTKQSETKNTAEREHELNEARKRLDEAAREVAELSMELSNDVMPRVAHIMGRQLSRSMLGVNIGAHRDDDRKDGVEIVNVSPGGAAAEAGLKAGDVLIEIKDKPLKQIGDTTPRDQLLAVMRDIEPDEKVKVRYLRNGKTATVTVAPRRMDRMVSMPFLHGPGNPGELPSYGFMRSVGAFGSAELVALTPKLGQYFGTDRGLLVVRAPADSRLKLEEGDVIVDIDGRVPTNASHALRILSSYQAGEHLKVTVQRMRKRTTFDITVPDDVLEHRSEDRHFRMQRDVLVPAPAPVPPVPAMPPVPPTGRDDTA